MCVAGSDRVAIGTNGNASATTLTDDYKAFIRERIHSRQEAAIAAPLETEEGYLFANNLNAPRRIETIGELLLKRSHSAGTVGKVLGGNLARVFADIWE
jgi:membrane dipeptidase